MQSIEENRVFYDFIEPKRKCSTNDCQVGTGEIN